MLTRGNFLSLNEMMSKFYLIMQYYVKCIQCKEIPHHYLGPRIQNEMLSFLAHAVRISMKRQTIFL